MPFPPEFGFVNEDDFVQRLLIPLLQRLGFSVVNYHGTNEHGRDLILAEFDRFGDIRYHGLQAKYVPSISKTVAHKLVEACKESFVTPFNHPQTGSEERISTFYAVNGGSISVQARKHFFNSLSQYGANVRLLDGKALVALDRSVSFNRGEVLRETLMGILIEIQYNKIHVRNIVTMIMLNLNDQSKPLPLNTLRDTALSNYLARPIAGSDINQNNIGRYLALVESFTETIKYCLYTVVGSKENKKQLLLDILGTSSHFQLLGIEIENQATAVLKQLGPITGL